MANLMIQKIKSGKRPSWARIVSDVVSPPLVWAVIALPVALQYARNTQNAIFWTLFYGLFISLIPILYVAYNVKRGNIGDIHMKERRERLRPFMVSLLSTAIAWWLLRVLGAPRALPLLALMSFIQIAVMALITIVWQVSMHMMSIAGAVIAVAMVFSMGTAFMLVPLVPLVAAARLQLHRHTPAQVLVGTVIGSVLPVMVLSFMPLSFLQAM